jgi:50S ribosome-binding GTPase
MTADFRAWADQVCQLDVALRRLEPKAAHLGISSPTTTNWYQLLDRKLVPQLRSDPHLVVGVVGGTNIGKSVLFNQLAGEVASAVSPLAAGTKHPVCLVPPDTDDPDLLVGLFDGFALKPWQSADDPLRESAEDTLFWRAGTNVPPRLLLIDAPDVDSDAMVNWDRARAIRQAADVLIAVLTQQKYNDAAVKQFFREAAQADKPVIVVFNQCDLELDRTFWPQWLDTFCAETGIVPEFVYVAPHDRTAAESRNLPIYSVGNNGDREPEPAGNLREQLAAFHFDAIKIRTFRGALGCVLDEGSGLPAYLASLRKASGEFAAAAETLSASDMARVVWPNLPAGVLVNEIRAWWDSGRSTWSQKIHGFYRSVGQQVVRPVQALWSAGRPDSDPLEAFRQEERGAIVRAVESILDELERLSKIGNDTLRPRLLELLGGDARQQLLQRVRTAHEQLPAVDEDYREFLCAELDLWRSENPRVVRFLRSLDHVAALARPALTLTLAVSGFVVAGDLVGQAAVQAASHTATELAAEAAIAGGIAGGGEAVVSTAGEGVRQAAGRLFVRLQTRYAQRRAQWLAGWLESELLGGLLADLRQGAEVPESKEFGAVESAMAAIQVV